MARGKGWDQGAAALTGEWVLGRRPAPTPTGGGLPHWPDILLLVDAATGFVFGSEVVDRRTSHGEVAAWAEELLEPGIGLRVDDERLAGALRARLGPDHPVRVGPIPELRGALAALTRLVRSGRGRREEPPPWTDDSSPEARIGFYSVAARFERSAPWEVAGDGQVLGLDVPALGWEGACASILGAAGEEFGLLILRSLEDYVTLARLAEPVSRRREPKVGIPILSVNFEDPAAVTGGELLESEARSLGWKPGKSGRIAYLLKLDAEDAPAPLTTDDYRLAAVCTEAVRLFVEKQRRLFRDPPKERIEMLVRLAMPEGAVEVRVTAPPEGVRWAWGEEEPIDGLRREGVVPVREAFLEARVAAGASEDEVEQASLVVDEALLYKAERGEPVDRWTDDDVEEYLLYYYPRWGGAPDEELELVPLHLDAFLAWLATSGRAQPGPLLRARARLARCREPFLRDARDPKLFDPAKAVARAMLKEGIDPSNRRAANRYLAKFAKRVYDDPSLLPTPADAARSRRRWTPTPGQPAADPAAPCPCGSGRRYRKCCMPR